MKFRSRMIQCLGAFIGAGLLIIACGGSDASNSSQALCTEGAQDPCTCDDGSSGAMTCDSNGEWSTCVCSTCGNGVIDDGEMCDGANLNNETCQSVSLNAQPSGQLRCSATCTFDESGCTSTMGSGGTSGGGGTSGFGGTSGGGGLLGAP